MSTDHGFGLLERLLLEEPPRYRVGEEIPDGVAVLHAHLEWRTQFWNLSTPDCVRRLLGALRDEQARHINTLSELHVTRTRLAAQESALSDLTARVDAALPAEGKDDA